MVRQVCILCTVIYPKLISGTDDVLYYQNFLEEVKQWTNVFGVSTTPSNTVPDYAVAGWTRYDYGPNVMGISAAGVGHGISYQSTQIMQWFGL